MVGVGDWLMLVEEDLQRRYEGIRPEIREKERENTEERGERQRESFSE